MKKSDKKTHTKFSVPKCFNTPALHTTNAHFYNPRAKIGFVCFFSHLLTIKKSTSFSDATLLALILHLTHF